MRVKLELPAVSSGVSFVEKQQDGDKSLEKRKNMNLAVLLCPDECGFIKAGV